MYTLLVCADIYGEKVNLELTFPSVPNLADLQRKILAAFGSEENHRHPPGVPVVDFIIARIQVYDDVLMNWVDLVSPTQLHEYDQLYVFQPQSSWHTDVQKDLPPPCPPSQSRAASAMHSGRNTQYRHSMGSAIKRCLPSAHETSGGSMNTSNIATPTKMRLDEQRRRERELQEELMRVHSEAERLEREAAVEEEEQRMREEEQMTRMLRQKEDEVRRQREVLVRAEEEFQRLQAQKRTHTNSY